MLYEEYRTFVKFGQIGRPIGVKELLAFESIANRIEEFAVEETVDDAGR